MEYYEFQVGEKTYKLRLNCRNIIKLEKLLGGNPLNIFVDVKSGKLPTVQSMVTVLYTSMLCYQKDMSLDKCYDLFDEWLSEGHIMTDFVNDLLKIYQVSGLIEANSKN